VKRTWTPREIIEGVLRAGNPTSPAILVCLPTVQLGNTTLKDQVVRAQTKSDAGAFSSEDFSGILGSDILRQFEITFDFKHDRVFLQRDENYQPDPYRYVTIGIQIAKDARNGIDMPPFGLKEFRCDSASMLRGFQQLLQILLPHSRPGVSAVTMSSLGDRNQHETTFLHSFDFTLRNSEFRRIDEIVG
jgi:hypothetical protein